MACESFLTYGNKAVGHEIVQLYSFSQFSTELASLAGNFGCALALTILNTNIATQSSGILVDGTVVSKSDISLSTVGVFEGTDLVLTIDGVTYGSWLFTGGIWVDNTTYGDTYIFGPGNIGQLTTSFSTAEPITCNVTNAVLGGDAPGYLGCVAPECAVAPPTLALPQLGPTVKCANFSKIFNPLGISIKGTK